MVECKNNTGKSSTAKVGEHMSSTFSISKILSFTDIMKAWCIKRWTFHEKVFWMLNKAYKKDNWF